MSSFNNKKGGAGRSSFAIAMASPMALWQLCFFAAAFLFLVVMSFWRVEDYQLLADMTGQNWRKMFSTSFFWSAYRYTFLMSVTCAAVATVFALPLSYWMAFVLSKRAQLVAAALLITPFFTSYVIKIYAWRLILTEEGVLNAALGLFGVGPIEILNTAGATVVGVLTLSFPLVALLQYFSLANVDRVLIEAAQNLGCRPFSVVFRIIIPSAKTGIALAAVLTFILAFGDFISSSFLGGNKPPTMSNLMIDAVKSGNNYPRAAVIAITMVVTLCLAAISVLSYVYGISGRKK